MYVCVYVCMYVVTWVCRYVQTHTQLHANFQDNLEIINNFSVKIIERVDINNNVMLFLKDPFYYLKIQI